MNIFNANRIDENIKRIKEQLGSSSKSQELEQKSQGGMGGSGCGGAGQL